VIGEAFRDESGRVVFLIWIHVKTPGVDHNDGTFGDEFAVDPVICNLSAATV
jgi:hypothetical protein